MKCIVYSILCIFLSCCQSNRKEQKQEVLLADSVLSICGVKQIYMDDLNYPTSGHIRYSEDNGKPCLIQSNDRQKTIRVYDYFSGEKLSEIKLEKMKGEFFAYNISTAFAIAGERDRTTIFSWIDSQMKEIKIPIKKGEGHIEQYPRCRFDGGVFLGGKWYFSCFRLGEYPNEMKSGKDRFPLLELNLEENSYKFVGAYPEIYAHNNMGTLNYWVPDLCRGKDTGDIVMGFKASPEILIYSPKTEKFHFESVKSIYADTIPLPLTEKGRDFFNESDSYYYFAQYAHYGAMSYDPWRKIYYRFVGIGLNDWKLESSPLLQNQKRWSVLVFDESFKKLGEQYLGDKYDVNFHFVSPDGLYILNQDKDENIANYTLLKYKEREL